MKREAEVRIIQCLAATLALVALPPDLGRAEQHTGKRPAASLTARVMASMASGHARSRHQEPRPHGSGSVQVNAVGVAVRTVAVAGHDDAGRTPADASTTRVHAATTPVPAIAHAAAAASAGPVHHSVGVTGTGVVRLGAGPATIGGAGIRSASINGTAVRAKR